MPNVSREKCPLSSGITVRFETESVSALKRNHCPPLSGITVRFEPDFVIQTLFIIMTETD